MKSLLKKVKFKLVCLLIDNSEQRGLEKFFQNSTFYWIKRYQAFEKDGTELQKYCAQELGKYKKERDEVQDKYFEIMQDYNKLMNTMKIINESRITA